jgi:hypothetical protein
MLVHNSSRAASDGCGIAWGDIKTLRVGYVNPYARWGSPRELKALGLAVSLGATMHGCVHSWARGQILRVVDVRSTMTLEGKCGQDGDCGVPAARGLGLGAAARGMP